MSGESKMREIYGTLRAEIGDGKYRAARTFPSDVALARRFACSPQPVKRAMEQLQRDGLVLRRPGRGTFLTKMARNATGKIGVIVPGLAHEEIFAPICEALVRIGQQNGYQVVFGDLASPDPVRRAAKAQRLARDFAAAHVEAVAFQPIELVSDAEGISGKIASLLDAGGIRVVLLDFDIVNPPKRSAFDVVGIDNEAAGYRLGRHLAEAGARHVHFLVRPNWAPTTLRRMRGVASAVWEATGAWSRNCVLEAEPEDVDAIRRHFSRRGMARPDAFVCGNDTAALKFVKSLGALGLKVPDDVMVAGFDDVQHATFSTPALTTMRQPCQELADVLFRTMVERVRHPDLPPREIMLDAPLVVRASTRRKA